MSDVFARTQDADRRYGDAFTDSLTATAFARAPRHDGDAAVSPMAAKTDHYAKIYFDTAAYLENKVAALHAQGETDRTVATVAEAISDIQMTAWDHFVTYGAWETAADGGLGINPSDYFDVDRYYGDKIDQCQRDEGVVYTKESLAAAFRAADLDPVSHYAAYGFAEGLVPRAANLAARNFDTPDLIPLSGDTNIDALLTEDLNWNALLDGNVITVCFAASAAEIREATDLGEKDYLVDFTAYGEDQRADALDALAYISGVTGINIATTDSVADANFILYTSNLVDPCEASGMTVYMGLTTQALVIVDNSYATDLGHGEGRETLIHELGHALGLKHPFDVDAHNATRLSETEDSLINTIMSYTYPDADHWVYTTASNEYYMPYDAMALGYLYGTDGINGAEGLVYSGA